MSDATTPRSVALDVRGNLLTIGWGDGHVSRYEGGYLRWTCPCAGCRGHAPGEVEPPAWEACKDVRVSNAVAVGAYAVRFAFSDGHEGGIYSWEWLREVCPSRAGGRDGGPG